MSFTCQSCGVAQEARVKPHKVVIETRNVQYPPVKDVNGNVRIPVGYETVQEWNVCQSCKDELKNSSCKIVDSKVLQEVKNSHVI